MFVSHINIIVFILTMPTADIGIFYFIPRCTHQILLKCNFVINCSSPYWVLWIDAWRVYQPRFVFSQSRPITQVDTFVLRAHVHYHQVSFCWRQWPSRITKRKIVDKVPFTVHHLIIIRVYGYEMYGRYVS